MPAPLLALLALAPCAAARGAPGPPRAYLARLEGVAGLETPVVRAPFACAELVPSWNVSAAADASFVVELAVSDGPDAWSPWLLVGAFGHSPEELARLAAGLDGRTRSPAGRVAVDTFVAARPFDRARLRVVAGEAGRPVLARAAFAFTARSSRPSAGEPPVSARSTLPVPFRSQQDAAPELRARVCSPTALAMVLAARGLARPTAEVARAVHDPLHDLYGNWSRATQAAWSFGAPAWVARFDSWDAVARALERGPLVVSVRVEPGELPGAPFASSEGHLLVLEALEDGAALVCDPAFPSEALGRTRYPCAALERVWLARRRGTAYVIAARPERAARPAAPAAAGSTGG